MQRRGGRPEPALRPALARLDDLRRGASWLDAVVVLTLLVCTFYPAYRYPLQINDTSTSPTYSDTPTTLQAGKYVLLAPLALVATWYVARRVGRMSTRDWVLAALAVIAAGRAAVVVMEERSVATADVLGPVAAVAPIALAAGIGLARSERARALGEAAFAFAAALLLAHFVANAIQVLLWAAIGRLPALAYPDSYSARFGGLWDDPNSTGTYSAAVLVFLAARRIPVPRRTEAVLALAAVANIVAAQSFSAGVLLVVGLAALIAVRLAERRSARGVQRDVLPLLGGVGFATAVLAAGAALIPVVTDLPVLERLLEGKERSLRLRLQGETWFASPGEPLEWLGGSDHPRMVENAFGNILAATGLIGLTLLVAWLVLTVWAVRETREFAWLASLVVALSVSSLFVPHLTVFPIASLAVLAFGVAPAFYDTQRSANASHDDRPRVLRERTISALPVRGRRTSSS